MWPSRPLCLTTVAQNLEFQVEVKIKEWSFEWGESTISFSAVSWACHVHLVFILVFCFCRGHGRGHGCWSGVKERAQCLAEGGAKCSKEDPSRQVALTGCVQRDLVDMTLMSYSAMSGT